MVNGFDSESVIYGMKLVETVAENLGASVDTSALWSLTVDLSVIKYVKKSYLVQVFLLN